MSLPPPSNPAALDRYGAIADGPRSCLPLSVTGRFEPRHFAGTRAAPRSSQRIAI